MNPNEVLSKYVLPGTVIAGIGIAAWYLVRQEVQANRVAAVETESLNRLNPASFASRLKLAFENDNPMGWGTNEAEIYKVFGELPTKAFYLKVQSAYKTLYGKDLNAILKDELTVAEYARVMSIYNKKREK